MTIQVGGAAGGGGFANYPTMPAPLNGEGLISKTGDLIPHDGTLVDQINLPTAFGTGATGDYVGLLGTTTVWTVNATDVNAACDGWAGLYSHWYDSTNDRLYVFGLDQGTTPDTLYTAYITVETGAITNVGNFQLSTDPTSFNTTRYCNTKRGAIASGDFSLVGIDRTVVVDETTGAENSNTATIVTTESSPPGTYTTLDGDIMVGEISFNGTDTYFIELTRGANTVRVSLGNIWLSDQTSAFVHVLNWGDRVKIAQWGSTSNTKIIRTFLRSEFDAWLVLLCDWGGLA